MSQRNLRTATVAVAIFAASCTSTSDPDPGPSLWWKIAATAAEGGKILGPAVASERGASWGSGLASSLRPLERQITKQLALALADALHKEGLKRIKKRELEILLMRVQIEELKRRGASEASIVKEQTKALKKKIAGDAEVIVVESAISLLHSVAEEMSAQEAAE